MWLGTAVQSHDGMNVVTSLHGQSEITKLGKRLAVCNPLFALLDGAHRMRPSQVSLLGPSICM